MYQQNEGARSQQATGTTNEELARNSPDTTRQEATHTEALKDEQKDALSTRTPERWWLRKRLMQG